MEINIANEKLVNNMLTEEEYIKVKNYAYRFIAYLTEKNQTCGTGIYAEELPKFIKAVCPYEIGSIEYQIFLNTIYIPNDIQFLQALRNNKFSESSKIMKELNIPSYMLGIVASKTIELAAHKFEKLIESGKIEREKASLENSILYQQPLSIIGIPVIDDGKLVLENLRKK